ncbi:HAMP domain-containing sensor histidine kinase [Tissierella sp. MB52-C2]|uniref:sensor histidine kinase n=1 Tax=Tissierella sp. MB52-C2 TaxID=3070999 RepID=UPI00280A9097|nr:HAMP domain-containing sensor histidine kinase [Tissierella sp. MB52-C2]WMM26351.1 HAMP domain-containing sensor histidine kinase [Tissierella sp. MB52-C2]
MKNKNNRIYRIISFISILLISISMVSSIGIWKNRSFFFDGYIYSNYLNSSVREYCSEVYRFITGDMSDKEKESFQVENQGAYYYIIDDNTKEIFTNLPEYTNYIEFSSQPNIISFEYNDNQKLFLKNVEEFKLSIVESDYIVDIDPEHRNFSGFVFIDKNNEFASGILRYTIEIGFKQQKILYLEIKIAVISLLVGVTLYLISYKKMIRTLNEVMNVIPIDVRLGAPILALILLVFLFRTYLYTIGLFSQLLSRIILYVIFVILIFIMLTGSILLIIKVDEYKRDNMKFNQEWENRLTQNIPSWIIGLILQLIWYFFTLSFFAPGRSTIYDYISMIRTKWVIVVVHNLIILIFFILIRQIIINKRIYAREVISITQEIANGDLEQSIPIVGNDGYAKIAHNINEIKENYIHALEEQKKSERLKYELVTNISHDLKTPITSIINYIELVKKKGVSNEIEKYILNADMNAKRLNILIEDLFELSRIESGNIQLDISKVDIVLMIKQIGYEYTERMKEAKLELVVETTSKQILWSCDSLKMWRVFDNIIINAVKYSLPNTRIYVAITENIKERQLTVSIKNISSYRMEFETDELFLRFKRADSSRSSEGSGLGLAIAKSIIEFHHGSINIETEGDMFKVIIQLNDISL